MEHTAEPCQLLCSPYAGGSATVYNAWDEGWHRLATVRALQLSGRSPRIREKAFTPMADRELPTLILPILRADCELGEHYHGTVAQQLDISATEMGGLKDATASKAQLSEWSQLTSEAFELHMLDGDHFFFNTQRTAFRQSVATILRRYSDETGNDHA